MKNQSAVSPVFNRLPTVENELANISTNCRVLPLSARKWPLDRSAPSSLCMYLVIVTACKNNEERNSKYDASKTSNTRV
jgi:hypothetical protein